MSAFLSPPEAGEKILRQKAAPVIRERLKYSAKFCQSRSDYSSSLLLRLIATKQSTAAAANSAPFISTFEPVLGFSLLPVPVELVPVPVELLSVPVPVELELFDISVPVPVPEFDDVSESASVPLPELVLSEPFEPLFVRSVPVPVLEDVSVEVPELVPVLSEDVLSESLSVLVLLEESFTGVESFLLESSVLLLSPSP